jgi:hypothetical protein
MGSGVNDVLGSGVQAISLATARAEEAAMALAVASGANEPRVQVSITRHYLPDASNDEGLLSAVVSAEAIGRPHQ